MKTFEKVVLTALLILLIAALAATLFTRGWADSPRRLHVDAVQAAGKLPLEMDAIGCHLLTISGHKMHAPQGTGALFVRRGTRLEPLFAGGAHERQRRAGTENVAGIVGLGKLLES